MPRVPDLRLRAVNTAPVNRDGQYVVYWMIAARRTTWNFALDRAIEQAKELGKPLVVFEPLRVAYPWASDRLHRFVIEGMRDNATHLEKAGVTYYPYVEPTAGAGHGLLEALAERAALVVTDEFPCFFLPRMVAAAGNRLKVRLEAVDSCGILPLRATDTTYPTAYAFRRVLQKILPEYLSERPRPEPFRDASLPLAKLPGEFLERWPRADLETLLEVGGLAELPIDHDVRPATFAGGSRAAEATLKLFIERKLSAYNEARNEPDEDGASGLSPYLHFGHVSAHEIFDRLVRREKWSPDKLSGKAAGKRAGWWGLSEPTEAFLDQLITWRELGYNYCSKRDDYERYDSLPDWAKATLAKHARDPRPIVYSRDELSAAATHDPLWNAAQRQLTRDGKLHNYLRMLWGKKILEWSATPQEALATMIALNDRFAVDGRDPNSYSGIGWVLGRYDRAWGPERPIFGTIRYMSSDNTARKLSVKKYLDRYGA